VLISPWLMVQIHILATLIADRPVTPTICPILEPVPRGQVFVLHTRKRTVRLLDADFSVTPTHPENQFQETRGVLVPPPWNERQQQGHVPFATLRIGIGRSCATSSQMPYYDEDNAQKVTSCPSHCPKSGLNSDRERILPINPWQGSG